MDAICRIWTLFWIIVCVVNPFVWHILATYGPVSYTSQGDWHKSGTIHCTSIYGFLVTELVAMILAVFPWLTYDEQGKK